MGLVCCCLFFLWYKGDFCVVHPTLIYFIVPDTKPLFSLVLQLVVSSFVLCFNLVGMTSPWWAHFPIFLAGKKLVLHCMSNFVISIIVIATERLF